MVKKPGSGEIVGHVLDKLAKVLSPLLSLGEVQIMKCEVSGLSKAADEGVWVQEGEIVIPFTYILLGKRWARKRRQADSGDTKVIKKEKLDSK